MARKSDKSGLLEDYNRKREIVSSILMELLMNVQGRKVKPYNFGVAKDGGFCVFIRGDGFQKANLDELQKASKKNNFFIYIATESICYIVKPNEIKEYNGLQADKFREVLSEEISKFHMRLIVS